MAGDDIPSLLRLGSIFYILISTLLYSGTQEYWTVYAAGFFLVVSPGSLLR